MRSPALAIAWEFSRRHRWGLAALVAYLLLMGATDLLVLDQAAVRPDESRDLPVHVAPQFAARVTVPVMTFTYYFLAVFSFGFTGNLTARQSLYPARMFTLPVTTARLAFWPVLYGTAAMASLWIAAVRFVVWPSGMDLPLIWPPLFAVAVLGWTQVLMWLPYGLPGLRVVVAVAWLSAIGAVVVTAVELQVSESVMVAFLAPQVPLAYLGARFALAKARRGDVPDWWQPLARLGRIARMLPRRQPRFASAARAQLWFEWRLHGRSLPVWVGILVPCELALLFVAGTGTPSLVAYTVFGVLLTPPFMAAFSVPRVRTSNPLVSDGYGMAPFVATRPLATAALIAAKLRMAMWSTLATWLLVLTAIPIALTLSGTWPVVSDWARKLSGAVGTPRATVVALLGLLGLMASTWKQLVQSLSIGLSGREWLIRTAACLTLLLLTFIEPIVEWIRGSSDVRVALWNALPWILAGLVGVKMLAAGWTATRLHHSRLLTDRTLVVGAACWLGAVLALHGLFVWFVYTSRFPHYVLLLLAILALPLARVSAAPLALASNRHR